jgi:very-short-patch-repair endonuclease
MAPRRTIEQARNFRRTTTVPEVRLWSTLRSRPAGLSFRRQRPIGPFILDFHCAQAKLAIGVDGMAHDLGDRPRRDDIRDRRLAEMEISTLRRPATAVMNHLDAVVAHILERSASPLHHPSDGPPPHAAHGEDQ